MNVKRLGTWLLLLFILLCFWLGTARLAHRQQQEDIRHLEQALRRTAVACYAAEGAYPPDLAHMVNHYGLQYDETRFQVYYHIFASNLMPDITVLVK